MSNQLSVSENFVEYMVHIKESPFLKKREGTYPIRITRCGREFAQISGTMREFKRNDTDLRPWRIAVIPRYIHTIEMFPIMPKMVDISGYEQGSGHEMMTYMDSTGTNKKMRCRGTEWYSVIKDGDEVTISDEDGKVFGVYRSYRGSSLEHPDRVGSALLDPASLPAQIAAFLITFIHEQHGL